MKSHPIIIFINKIVDKTHTVTSIGTEDKSYKLKHPFTNVCVCVCVNPRKLLQANEMYLHEILS